MFKNFLQGLSKATESLISEVSEFTKSIKDKAKIKLVLSGGILMGYADKDCDADEKEKVRQLGARAFSHLSESDVQGYVTPMITDFDADIDYFIDEYLDKLEALKGTPEAKAVTRFAKSVAKASNGVDQSEQDMYDRICEAVGLETENIMS